MEILYRLGEASVADIEAEMADATSYDAVRLTLTALEDKGHVRHSRDGRRYIYRPAVPVTTASRSAAHRLLHTYFSGSTSKAILGLIEASDERLSDDELREIARIVREAKKGRR